MPQIHLHAEPGDYAPVVILPGDPIRATKIAGRFDGGLEATRQVNNNRGLVGYTGTVDGAKAKVTREVDAGLETIEVDLPAVFTSDLRLNEPRYVNLPDIMKAKKKPLDTITLASLGVESAPQFKVQKYEPPASRSKGVMVKDVNELVAALKQKGLV